jgi:protoporphyrinogen/coproporphyrinogen III oxidase
MKPVAIIGGGITGLTAAFRLRQKNIPVTVYEASDRVGGAIQSIRRDGYLAEFGPNTIMETSPKVAALIEDLGLGDRRLYSDPAAKNRYLVRRGRLVKMPESLVGLILTPLFSTVAKLRLLFEPFILPGDATREESIAEFVRRRLGAEFLDRAIDALVGGIYAGDPQKLSVQQAFPKLYQLEQKYGSLIRGQILGARERKRRAEVAKPKAKTFSFDEGLQVLPDTLLARMSAEMRLCSPVSKLTQIGDAWNAISQTNGPGTEHSAVVCAATAFGFSRIKIETNRPVRLGNLADIYYAPVASVALGFRREDVAHPLDGFGVLVPGAEGFRILGTIFSSSLFPNRAPAGCVMLTSYIGGARSPELARRSAEELFEITREDLRVLLGATGRPTFRHHVLFSKAIPQYDVGYASFKRLMSQAERNAPGLFFAGHYREGISVSDCIVSGQQAAERVAEYLTHTRAGTRPHSSPFRLPATA